MVKKICASSWLNTEINVCSMSAVMVSMAVLIRTFSSEIHTHPVSWNCAYHLRMELSDGGCFPNLVRNCRWTIVSRQSFWITLYFVSSFLITNWCISSRWVTAELEVRYPIIATDCSYSYRWKRTHISEYRYLCYLTNWTVLSVNISFSTHK